MEYPVLKTNIILTVWQTVRRMTDKILGVKGLKSKWHVLHPKILFVRFAYRLVSIDLSTHKNKPFLNATDWQSKLSVDEQHFWASEFTAMAFSVNPSSKYACANL